MEEPTNDEELSLITNSLIEHWRAIAKLERLVTSQQEQIDSLRRTVTSQEAVIGKLYEAARGQQGQIAGILELVIPPEAA